MLYEVKGKLVKYTKYREKGQERKMRNIEIRANSLFLKKTFISSLVSMMVLGMFTINKVDAKASVSEPLPASVKENARAVTPQKSAPKKITFIYSTVYVNKYASRLITSCLKATPTVVNTDADLTGIKYWTGNPNVAYVSGNSIIGKSEGKTWLYVETPNKVRAKVSVSVRSSSVYVSATSDPKKVYFGESTIKIAKYESDSVTRAVKAIPKVAGTVPYIRGAKYWTGNPEIAYVSGNAIYAKKEGRTWLYIETPNKLTAKVSVLVTPQKDYSRVSFLEKVTNIGLNQNLNINDLVFQTITASDASSVMKPNIKYTYRIGNSKLAKVSANGIVQALSKGRTWLYVKSESGYENRISLNIVDTQKKAASVTLPTSQIVNIKEKVKLKAIVSPTNSKVASWRIGNSKVATINQSGVVTGVSVGNTYAYAKLANGKEVRSLIKVQNPNMLVINHYKYDGDSVEINGSVIALDTRIIQKDSKSYMPYDFTKLKVKTGNSKIAAVSKIENDSRYYGGKNHDFGIITVKAISNGNTWLHLETTDGLKSKFLLKVKKQPLKEFSMPDKFIVEKHEGQYMSDQLNVDSAYRNSVKFRTGNSKIAKITEDGYLIGVSEGLTYLYAECQGKTLKSLVSVKSGPTIKSIKFDQSVININAKKNMSQKPMVTFSPVNAINQKLSYKVGNEKIAVVSSNGYITGKSNGSTYVYATAPNGVTTKALVKVTGFDEIKQINAPRTVDVNLSDNTPGNKEYDWKAYECTATMNTAYGNKEDDVEVFIGNKSIVEVKDVNINGSKIYVQYIPKSQGNTYLNFKMPNGKIVKTLIKVHW